MFGNSEMGVFNSLLIYVVSRQYSSVWCAYGVSHFIGAEYWVGCLSIGTLSVTADG